MTLISFNQHRMQLFNIAYRMLGSVTEAEDMLQETWFRWERLEHTNIRTAKAYLAKIVTNLCLDLLRSKKSEKESYVGPWLPEPLLTGYKEDPSYCAEVSHDLSIALLFILEQLKPRERAVFVLKEALGFSHQEIAQTIDIDIQNSRKLLSRARKQLAGNTPKSTMNRQIKNEKLTQLMSSLASNNVEEIKNLLAIDAIAYTDGGGIVSAALIPLQGVDRIIQVFSHLLKKYEVAPRIEYLEVNGEPSMVVFEGQTLNSIISFAYDNERISKIFVQRNPLKLENFNKQRMLMSE